MYTEQNIFVTNLGSQAQTDYYANLYRAMFENYIKQTGPWRNAWVSDGGPDLVTVKFDTALLAVELLVSLADVSLFLWQCFTALTFWQRSCT